MPNFFKKTKMALPEPFLLDGARKGGPRDTANQVSKIFSAGNPWNDTLIQVSLAGINQQTIIKLNSINIYTCKHLWQMLQDVINNGLVGNSPTDEMETMKNSLPQASQNTAPWIEPRTCYLCNLSIWTKDMARSNLARPEDITELTTSISNLKSSITSLSSLPTNVQSGINSIPLPSQPTYLYCWSMNSWVNKINNYINDYRSGTFDEQQAATTKIRLYLSRSPSQIDNDFTKNPCYQEAEHVAFYTRALYAGILSTNPNPLERALAAFKDFLTVIRVRMESVGLETAFQFATENTNAGSPSPANLDAATATLKTNPADADAIRTLDTQFYKQRFLSRAYIANAWLNEYKPSHTCCNQFKSQGDFLNWNANQNLTNPNGSYVVDTTNIDLFYKDLMGIGGLTKNGDAWVDKFLSKDGPIGLNGLATTPNFGPVKDNTVLTVSRITELLNNSENINAEYYKTTLFLYVYKKFVFWTPPPSPVSNPGAVTNIQNLETNSYNAISQGNTDALIAAVSGATSGINISVGTAIMDPVTADAAAATSVLLNSGDEAVTESSFPTKTSEAVKRTAADAELAVLNPRDYELVGNRMMVNVGPNKVDSARRRLNPPDQIRESNEVLEGYNIIDNLDNDKYGNLTRLCNIYFKLVRKAIQGLAPNSIELITTLRNLIITFTNSGRPTRERKPSGAAQEAEANRQAEQQLKAAAAAEKAAAAAAAAAAKAAKIASSKTKTTIENKSKSGQFLTCDTALRLLNEVLATGVTLPEDLSKWQSSSFPNRTAVDLSNFKFSSMPNGSTYVAQK